MWQSLLRGTRETPCCRHWVAVIGDAVPATPPLLVFAAEFARCQAGEDGANLRVSASLPRMRRARRRIRLLGSQARYLALPVVLDGMMISATCLSLGLISSTSLFASLA
jgi:hypothetical protein